MPANATRMTKAQRREAARKEAERLAAKQQKTERRNKIIIGSAITLVVALVLVAGYLIINDGRTVTLAEYDGPVPAQASDTGGIPVGADGAGSINDDGASLQVYLDFRCPYCGTYDQVNAADLEAMAADGTATVWMHPLNFLDTRADPYSSRAANAFATVAENAPDLALPFSEALFANQPGNPGLTYEEISAIAVGAGVPQDVADTFADDIYTDWVDAAAQTAREDGVTGTPTTFINGERWGVNGEWGTPGQLLGAVTAAGPAGNP